MTLTIRPLSLSDKSRWTELWRQYLAFYETELPEETYAATWSRLFAQGEYEPKCLVAEDDGAIVGLVHFMCHRHTWRTANVVYLQDLFVDEKARGKGAGRQLIHAVYEWADMNGTPTVYWMTQSFNTTARALYDEVASLTPFIKYQR